MSDAICVVSPDSWSSALELLISRMPTVSQAQQKEAILAALSTDASQAAGLLGSFQQAQLQAVCWLQIHPGRTATLWTPIGKGAVDRTIHLQLIAVAIKTAQVQNVVLVQSLLSTDACPEADLLRHAGFRHVADLLYLVSFTEAFPAALPESELTFVSLDHADERRFRHVIERTYRGTLDCPDLDGLRTVDDVVTGYRAMGKLRPDLWLLANWEGEDVGCILLSDHSAESVWEITYLGVAPEFRGKRFGLEITRYVQWVAREQGVERLVLAVDAANQPAIAMYAASGFTSWDRRSVFVRALNQP